MTNVAVSERQDPQTNPGLTANRPGPSRSNESPLLAASCRSLNATPNENQGRRTPNDERAATPTNGG